MRAPTPLHAAAFLDRLLGVRDPFGNLESCATALNQSRELPTQVDQPLRLAHITVQAMVLAIGLATMFIVSGLFSVFAALELDENLRSAERLLQTLDDPDGKARLATTPGMTPMLADENRLRSALVAQAAIDRAEFDRLHSSFNSLTRGLLLAVKPTSQPTAEIDVKTAGRALRHSSGSNRTLFEHFGDWQAACSIILFWPILWAAVAFALRGGFSYLLLGIGIVDGRGRPIRRRLAAVRVLCVWLPVGLLLCASVWIQAHHPTFVNWHSLMWLAALLLLPVYVGLALAQPDRPPQDRLLRTSLVPR